MDTAKLVAMLKGTIDPERRVESEASLEQVHKIIGFGPTLLRVVMMNEVEMPVRQAGVIYLKNLISNSWAEKEVEPGQELAFHIHEQDRAMIRDTIVDAVVHAPDIVRVQLGVCVNHIVKHDFPVRWSGIVEKVAIYLQMPDSNVWMGALIALYQLVKHFEYKKPADREPLHEAMKMLLPLLHDLCQRLLPEQSDQAVLVQKMILKIFYALTMYTLPLDLITKPIFTQWMQLACSIASTEVPAETNQVDIDERPELPWWKVKKWSLHILHRMFERFGSPGNVATEYEKFAQWYLKTFTAGTLEVLLKILDQYRNKSYVAPRVLQQCLNYLNEAVRHGYSWKFLKPHMLAILQQVVFPVMSYSDEDDELWKTDPHEYIRLKFDIFEDFVSPVTAAQTLLHSVVKKRKDMLQKTMGFAMHVLTAPDSDPRQKDGCLQMIGTLADILTKKQIYKEQMETMLVQYVFPEFNSPHGYLRARANWALHYFCDVKFKNDQNLCQALQLAVHSLLTDPDLPVRVEAAVAIQMLLGSQEKAQTFIEPKIKEISLELLKIIRETENDELTTVMQEIVQLYSEQLMPIACDMTSHLVGTFKQLLEDSEDAEEKALATMSILSTIETILTVFLENPTIQAQLEPVVVGVIGHIFQNNVMELYEEASSLVCVLTMKSVSPDLWKIFEIMYQAFEKDGVEYFTEFMPALHHFITIDTNLFLADPNRVLAMFNMCKAVLTGADVGDDTECHAAKLLEVMLLQCKGRIDACVPSFVELVLHRLMKEIKTSELRAMLLQVIIAALYYNPDLLLQTLKQVQINNTESVDSHFIKQWLHDTDCFLGIHDRKMCVIGLSLLISRTADRPTVVNELAQQILPAFIMVFEGLARAYAAKAVEENADSDDDEAEEEDDDAELDVLDSDEDELDENSMQYMEQLEGKVKKAGFNVHAEWQDDDDDDEDYETNLESYTTPLDDENNTVDEYSIFSQIFTAIQTSDPTWYATLTSGLTTEQQKSLQEIFKLAEQRRAAAESKRIQQSGGYLFQQQTVPTSFNFGGSGQIGR